MTKLIMAVIVGAGLLGGAGAAYAGVLKCDKCVCNLSTGVCDCNDCTISP